ncbi:peptidoglycan-binding domain-containing protein [Nocardia sp. NPDC051787]|uniref:peptidoglycan-binding domain-containing protein n=1 Tax=Nocardia sp. NPDC051787 TaxID=3155415 RepID=UPI00343250FD
MRNENEEKMGNMRMKVVGSIAAVLLSGTGLGVVTAAPATAATTCNDSVSQKDSRGRVAKIPIPGECTMREGNSGDAVRALQSTLWKCYGQNISRDGVFGPKTKSALIHAQKQAGAGADGIFGPETFGKINWAFFDGTEVNCHRYGHG